MECKPCVLEAGSGWITDVPQPPLSTVSGLHELYTSEALNSQGKKSGEKVGADSKPCTLLFLPAVPSSGGL